jgi:8-oxo-dGTP pyrophosphatase MutT (NUDIX family)
LEVAHLTAEEISRRLNALPYQKPHNDFPPGMLVGEKREAAVMVLLREITGEWHVQFIRRTEVEGDIHSGQVAFPGGRRDTTDATIIATALRETLEEIGIQASSVQVLGQLREFVTVSNYQVTPVVGVFTGNDRIQIQKTEVAHQFTIPLAWLADTANREERERKTSNGNAMHVIYFHEYDGELLWGATARFMVTFLEALDLK